MPGETATLSPFDRPSVDPTEGNVRSNVTRSIAGRLSPHCESRYDLREDDVVDEVLIVSFKEL